MARRSEVELKTTIERVETALAQGNLDEACQQSHRVLHELRLNGQSARQQRLEALEVDLRRRVVDEVEELQHRQQFDVADKLPVEVADKRLLELSRLLPLVGLPLRGLALYCEVCAQALLRELAASNLLLSALPPGAVVPYVDMLSRTLDAMAVQLRRHKTRMEAQFGPGAHLRLVQQLYHVVSGVVRELLERFEAQCSRMQAATRARQRDGGGDAWDEELAEAGGAGSDAAVGGAGSAADGGAGAGSRARRSSDDEAAAQLRNTLEEMVFVLREHEVFDRDLRTLCAAALRTLESTPQQAQLLREMRGDALGLTLPPVSALNEVVQRLSSLYLQLEGECMLRFAALAVRVDKYDPDSLCSTMVDEVFYVLKQCAERAFSSMIVHVSAAIVNHIRDLLGERFRKVLDVFAAQVKPAWQSTPALRAKLAAAPFLKLPDLVRFVLLNNLRTSAGHVALLKELLQQEARTKYAALDAKGMIGECLAGLDEVQSSFSEIVRKGLEKYAKEDVLTLRAELERFAQLSYDIRDDKEFAEREIADPFVDAFLDVVSTRVRPLKQILVEDNFQELLQMVVLSLCRALERLVVAKRFSLWGGLQLDKEVRKMAAFFGKLCARSVRDKFARLQQMASILQLERAAEVERVWDRSVWKLDDAQVRQLLALRFPKDEVERLPAALFKAPK